MFPAHPAAPADVQVDEPVFLVMLLVASLRSYIKKTDLYITLEFKVEAGEPVEEMTWT